MKNFTGTLTDANGTIFDVVGEWEAFVTPNDLDGWRGWVRAKDGRIISQGMHVLNLADGQKPKIMVNPVSLASSSAVGAAAFEGSGPLPR